MLHAVAAAAGAVFAPLIAQLRGTVVADSAPIRGALVTVRRDRPDGTLVATARTDSAGRFTVRGVGVGRYVLVVRALGFAPATRSASLDAGAAAVSLGTITLARTGTTLDRVVVRDERAGTVLGAARNSFEARELATASGGTALDLLRAVPVVEVDGDGTLSLRGDANVLVQLDGRAVTLRGQQLAAYLAQLPASQVVRIEVRTTPSSRDDPDGTAGIVNLVLARPAEETTSAGVTLGTATTGLASVAANVGRQRGRWTGYASLSALRDTRPLVGTSARMPDGMGMAPGAPAPLLGDFDASLRPASVSLTLRGEARLSRVHALAADAVATDGITWRVTDFDYRVPGRAERLVQASAVRTALRTLDATLAWRRTVDATRNALSLELRHARTDVDFTNALTRAAIDGTGAPVTSARTLDAARGDAPLWRAQLDWLRAFGTRTRLETGLVAIARDNASRFDRPQGLLEGGVAMQPLPTPAADFVWRERLGAGYAVLSRNAGKVELQGGVRLERTTTRTTVTPDSGAVARDGFEYLRLLPSALVTWTPRAGVQWKASWSRRLTRPDAGQLLPFVQREDTLNVFTGNTAVRPERADIVEVGWQSTRRWGTVQVTPYWRHVRDAIRYVRTVDTAGIARATFANLPLATALGTDVTLTGRASRLSWLASGNIFRGRGDAGRVAPEVSFRTVGWSARGNATWRITTAGELVLSAQYRAPFLSEAGEVRWLGTTSIAYRHRLRGDDMTLTLRLLDPFATLAFGLTSNVGGTTQRLDRNAGARAVGVTFSWATGRAPRLRAPRPDDPGPQGPPG